MPQAMEKKIKGPAIAESIPIKVSKSGLIRQVPMARRISLGKNKHNTPQKTAATMEVISCSI